MIPSSSPVYRQVAQRYRCEIQAGERPLRWSSEPSRSPGLRPLHQEGDLCRDAEVLDLIILDGGLELFDPDRGDATQCLRGFGDDLPRCIFPALFALAQQFDDFHDRHNMPPVTSSSPPRLPNAAPTCAE